jgi:hypothetical protein
MIISSFLGSLRDKKYCDVTHESRKYEAKDSTAKKFIARQRFGKYVPTATNLHKTTDELLEVMFPTRSGISRENPRC